MDTVAKLLSGIVSIFGAGPVGIIGGCVLLILIGVGVFFVSKKLTSMKINAADLQSNQQAAGDMGKVIEQNQNQAKADQSTINQALADKEAAKKQP